MRTPPLGTATRRPAICRVPTDVKTPTRGQIYSVIFGQMRVCQILLKRCHPEFLGPGHGVLPPFVRWAVDGRPLVEVRMTAVFGEHR